MSEAHAEQPISLDLIWEDPPDILSPEAQISTPLQWGEGEPQLERRDEDQETDENWRLQAACRGKPTEWFYPPKEAPHRLRARATLLCEGCPVRLICLEEGLKESHGHGIWGGLSERRRSQIRKERERQRRKGLNNGI